VTVHPSSLHLTAVHRPAASPCLPQAGNKTNSDSLFWAKLRCTCTIKGKWDLARVHLRRSDVLSPLRRPPVPQGSRFYIPIEILVDGDLTVLGEAQASLESFGFDRKRAQLSTFFQDTQIFTSKLQSKIYPVLKPFAYFAIYQDWEYVFPFPLPSDAR
jgi:hypothetical protein